MKRYYAKLDIMFPGLARTWEGGADTCEPARSSFSECFSEGSRVGILLGERINDREVDIPASFMIYAAIKTK